MRLRMLAALLLGTAITAQAQDPRPGQPGFVDRLTPAQKTHSHFGSSPFSPPDADDMNFVVDTGSGLDTGCTFRDGSPLSFRIRVDRVVGDVQRLRDNDLISETATLRMPAFDVDFDAFVPPFNPERDIVRFNGNVVNEVYLTGSDGVWKLNSFEIPIDWVQFPSDPGPGGSVEPVENTIEIEIDTANSELVWCTAIDWAALSIEVARPVVMAHGILSSGAIWNNLWAPRLNDVGILTDTDLNMGRLDSIQNNAQKIANVVERAKRRWGVDKVNIVCHSKGGLDSRHYVENEDTVEQILQLGTPNAGSPLADVGQGAALALLGPFATALVNIIAGPAGIQLTQPYMRLYNATHGSNPEVTYTIVAGDYDADCFFLNPFCRPLERILLLITGRGDTIVPVRSAHALPYTRNRTFASSGGDKDATHGGLHGSQRLYNANSNVVRQVGRAGLVTRAEDGYGRTATVGGLIGQGETRVHSVPIDEGKPAFISLMYPEGDLSLVLVSPSGRRIDPAAAGVDADIEYDAGDILGGRMAVYSINSLESGVWQAEVQGVALADPLNPVAYAVHGWIVGASVNLRGSFATESIRRGQPLDVFAALTDAGAPLTGAQARARIGLPDGTLSDLTLLDDGVGADVTAGDGIYSGRLASTSQPGLYRVLYLASGNNAAGAAFSREDFALATVSASQSALVGSYRERGVDTNSNGFFDQLVVEADLNITDTARYRVFAVLTDSAGNRHEATYTANLTAGPAVASLSFDGERIFQNRVNGPYTLSSITLMEEQDLASVPVAAASNAFTTRAWSYTQFEHSRIRLSGLGSATGVDVNGNGLYDLLNVTVGIEVDVSGFYQWSAQLSDRNGTELGFRSGSAFFTAGARNLPFTFNGFAIGENGVDGPYFITDLLLFGGGSSLVAGTAFETPAFLAREFEGFVFDTTPPTLSLTATPNVLWPPDHRLVDVAIGITVSDDVDPNPEVRLVSVVSSEADNGGGDGNTDDDIQGADIGSADESVQLRAERSGVGKVGRIYTLTYEATDAAGNSTTAQVQVSVPHNPSGN